MMVDQAAAPRRSRLFPEELPAQGQVAPPAAAPPRETGFGENFGAGFQEMLIAGNAGTGEYGLRTEYDRILQELGMRGELAQVNTGGSFGTLPAPFENPFSAPFTAAPGHLSREETFSRIWEAIARQRQRDPHFLSEFGTDRRDLERIVHQRNEAELHRIREVQAGATGWGNVGGFLGGMSGNLLDAGNLAALPTGGPARSLLGGVARSALNNMLVEAVEQPIVIGRYRALGEDRELSEAGPAILSAGIFGGALHVGGRGAGALYDRVLPHVFDALPAPLQRRWADSMTLGDGPDAPLLIDTLPHIVPPERWDPDTRAAVHVLERESEVRGATPFTSTPAGDEAHGARMQAAMRALETGEPFEVAAVPTPAARETDTRGTTAPAPVPSSSPNAAADFKARVRRNESGGNDRAQNSQPGQTASGRYQFTKSTWLGLHRRVFGGGMSDDARWAQRFDGATQERLMDVAVAGYEAVLRRGGQPVTPGNLYLSHFFGPEVAVNILRHPDMPLEAILRMTSSPRFVGQIFAVNPNLRRSMTGHDAAALTTRAMGGRAPEYRAGGEAPPAAAAPDGMDNAALFDLEAQMALRDAEAPADRAEATGAPDSERLAQSAFDDPPTLRRELFGSDEAWRAAQDRLDRDHRASVVGEGPPARETALAGAERRPGAREDVRTVLADAGGIRDDEGHDLIQGRNLQRFVPRAGPLIRRKGMSIDEAGELLWDRGFFGPPETSARPTTAQVLDMVERAAHEKVYTPELAADAELARLRESRPGEDDVWNEIAGSVREAWGDDAEVLDTPEIRRLAIDYYASGEYELQPAYDRALEDMSLEAIMAARGVTGDAAYDITSFDVEDFAPTRADREAQAGGRGQAADAGPSVAGAGAAEGASSRSRLAELRGGAASGALFEPAGLKKFDDPDGEGAAAQIASIEHDLRAELDRGAETDPAEAERRRQEAALRAGGPLRPGDVDQKGEMGLGLFDAADQPKFRLDEEGGERGLAEIMAELDAEEAAAKALRDCL
jgi:hypothetical protein